MLLISVQVKWVNIRNVIKIVLEKKKQLNTCYLG